MTREKITPKYTIHNGFRMPMGFPIENFASAINYTAQPGDIFIVTYPKCGTTWTQYIVWLIQNQGQPLSEGTRLDEKIPHLEEVGKEVVESLAIPRVIKTHLPFSMTPYHPDAKYIYVTRNPLDCVVSFYHHTRGFIKHYDFAEGSFDDFFECFLAGEVDFGDYFDNLMSWYEHKDDNNVLFLTYENMKADIRQAIRNIAEFIGYVKILKNEAILQKIISESSFVNMSKNQSRWSSMRPDNMPPFIRKGEIGDSKNYFSQEQKERLVEKIFTRTKGTDAAKLWGILS